MPMVQNLFQIYIGKKGKKKEKTSQSVENLLPRLAQSEHDASLRDQAVAKALCSPEHLQALPERSPPIADIGRQTLHRLDVMSIHIQPALSHPPHAGQVAGKVARERFDENVRRPLLDLSDGLGKVRGPAIRQVVPIDGCENHVAEAPPLQRFGRVLRLVRVQGRGGAGGLDGAEATAARAGVAHEHYRRRGGGLVRPAPARGDVWTSRLLAHRVQAQPAQVRLYAGEVGARGDGRLEPGWQAGDRVSVLVEGLGFVGLGGGFWRFPSGGAARDEV